MGQERVRVAWATVVFMMLSAGAGSSFAAAGLPATEPARPAPARKRLDYYRRLFLTDGYEKAGRHDPAWDASARAAIENYARVVAGDPLRTGDEQDAGRDAAGACLRSRCADSLVLYVAARLYDDRAMPEAQKLRLYCGAAERAAEADNKYPAMLRAEILFRGAGRAAGGARQNLLPKLAESSKEWAKKGMELLPAALADRDASPKAVETLFELIGASSADVEGDRFKLLSDAAPILEKSPVSKSLQLTVTGSALIQYAWDARGSGWASTVTPEGWKLFNERIEAARKTLEQAWRLDPTNASAAVEMLTIATAQGSTYAEMDRWYRRAIEANPASEAAINGKLFYLEPKWHGSADQMLAFGRELLKDGKWEARQPLQLVEVHFRLLQYERADTYYGQCAAYFGKHPEAWADVKAVYDEFLKRVPESRWHRTRYAMVAAWSGQWAEANRQFKSLGEHYAPLYPPELYRSMRKMAAERAGDKAEGP
ncbi:MAG TPA: hypothetical protein VH475_25670 [Tepidisphaeraceae bacterium]|jgi:hypothetical protein